MIETNKLFADESLLVFQPGLAITVGVNEAIVLQQIHYWVSNKETTGYHQDGFKWIYNTYENWRDRNFPFWSAQIIKRIFLKLEELGVIVSIQPMNYDRTKYYRIDYDKLRTLHGIKIVQWNNSKSNVHHNTENTSENTFNEQAAKPPAAQTTSPSPSSHSHTQNQNQNGTTPKESSYSSSNPPPSKKVAPKKVSPKPEPPAELRLESFAEQTLLRLLTDYNDKKGRTTPTHWGNHVQKQLFTDGAQRLTNEQLQAAILFRLNYNKSGLADIASGVKTCADRQVQFEAQGNGHRNGNGKAKPFSGFDGLKLLENGEW